MADENVEGDSPRSTSEATPPPYVGDSPESPDMVSQPPPEEERITSSTDRQPSEIADSPVELGVSSTSEQELNDGAGPSGQEPIAVRLLLETSEAGVVEGISPTSQRPRSDPGLQAVNQPPSDEPLNPEIHPLDAPLELPRGDEPPLSTAVEDESRTGMVGGAVEANQTPPEAAQTKEEGGQVESSQEITKDSIKQNVEDKSDDSNQQFDVEDLSPASKSSENVDSGSQSSPTGSGISVEEQVGSVSDATVDSGAESYSSPKLGIVITEEGNLEIPTENVSLESELSASKLDASIQGGATGNAGLKSQFSKTGPAMLGSGSDATKEFGLKNETSPSKTDTAGVEGSSSASSIPKKVGDNVSPKRKSPVKVDHLLPKRSAPFTSPDRLQVQSDSNMSSLLEELGIEETKHKPGSSETISGLEQENMETEESEECKNEEIEQESNMEVQETDSQNEQGEVAEKKC